MSCYFLSNGGPLNSHVPPGTVLPGLSISAANPLDPTNRTILFLNQRKFTGGEILGKSSGGIRECLPEGGLTLVSYAFSLGRM